MMHVLDMMDGFGDGAASRRMVRMRINEKVIF